MTYVRGTARCTRAIATPACSKKSRSGWTSFTCVMAGIGLITLIMQLTPDFSSNTKRNSTMTTEQLFLEWWKESYPHAKPAPHTITTHVAFAEYIDRKRTQDVLDSIAKAGAE
ncbi:MAG: hypothetical protein RL434_817 [Pseudomonadota bacterium]